jgi:hypothetical protein
MHRTESGFDRHIENCIPYRMCRFDSVKQKQIKVISITSHSYSRVLKTFYLKKLLVQKPTLVFLSSNVFFERHLVGFLGRGIGPFASSLPTTYNADTEK